MATTLEEYLPYRKDTLLRYKMPLKQMQYFFYCTIPDDIAHDLYDAYFPDDVAEHIEEMRN